MRCGTFEYVGPVKHALRAWEGAMAKDQNELLCPGRAPGEQAVAKEQAEKEAFVAQQNAIKKEVDERTTAVQKLQDKIEVESDPLKKQELIVKCRKEQLGLTQAAKNIESVAAKLDFVVDFLVSMQKDLAQINSKLDVLQDTVVAIHASCKWRSRTRSTRPTGRTLKTR